MHSSPGELANQEMVDRMIAEGALWSPALIAAFRATPRHRFLTSVFQCQRRGNRWREIVTRDPGPDELRLVYSDRALVTKLAGAAGLAIPISSSSQPSLMAQMLEDLRPAPGTRALEVGAGTGYNAALLAHVAGPEQVTSIDVDRGVLAEAWDHLRHFKDRHIELQQADGRLGYPTRAPYDRIVVTASTVDLEPAWLDQLADGGVLLAPLALAPGLAFLVCGTAHEGVFHGRLTRAAYFMALRGEGETGAETDLESPVLSSLQAAPAPWAGWFDRKHPRLHWQGLVQALVFYGLLRGLDVRHRGLANGQTLFGVSDRNAADVCWLGPQEWQVNGPAGRDLGLRLWRAFLDAGGPWPAEFDVVASPGGGLKAEGGECYLRQGPRCQQLWQLRERLERPAWL